MEYEWPKVTASDEQVLYRGNAECSQVWSLWML